MATSANKGFELQTTGANSGTWGSVLNSQALEYIDANLGGIVTKALTSSNVTLTAAEARNLVVRLTGTITANIVITNPNVGFYYVENRTTGSFAVTVTNGVGTPVSCPQGYTVSIVADATNGCRRGDDSPGTVFVASGASHDDGLVPDPGATAGTGRYLCEDATFVVPPFQWVPSGRLTLSSGVSVTTSDVTAASAVYYIAMTGNTVPVYGACPSATSQFAPVIITDGQLTLTLNNPNHAANTNYDVFMFLDGTTPRIGTGPPWTSSTARGSGAGTTEILLLLGVWVNVVSITARNGASTYSVAASKATYLGTIRIGSSAGTTEDSKLNRFVFNAYNRYSRSMRVVDTTNSWSYATTTWRQANGSASNQFAVILGLVGEAITAEVHATVGVEGTQPVAAGVGVNSTTVNSAQIFGTQVGPSAQTGPADAWYTDTPGIGHYVIAWIEIGNGVNNVWYGDTGTARLQSGMIGTVWA